MATNQHFLNICCGHKVALIGKRLVHKFEGSILCVQISILLLFFAHKLAFAQMYKLANCSRTVAFCGHKLAFRYNNLAFYENKLVLCKQISISLAFCGHEKGFYGQCMHLVCTKFVFCAYKFAVYTKLVLSAHKLEFFGHKWVFWANKLALNWHLVVTY